MAYKAGNAFITVAPSLDGFETKIRAEVAKIKDLRVHVKVDVDAKQAQAALDKLDLRDLTITAKVVLDDAAAKAKLAALGAKDINLNVVANTTKAKVELDKLARDRVVKYTAKADTSAARVELDALGRSRRATINVDADTGAAEAKIGFLRKAQQTLSLGGRGSFTQSSLIAAAVTTAPLTAPTALAGVGGFGSALIGSLGLAGVAASAIGNITQIVKAQGDLEDAQASLVSAAASATSAQLSLVNAEQSLATAHYNVTLAEQNLVSAQQRAVDAQRNLNLAREQAKRDLYDLTNQLKAAALAESGSKLAVEQAVQNLRALEFDPNATALEVAQAVQALKEARLQADEAAVTNKRTKEDAAKTRKAGVEGAQGVVAAQEQLAQAQLDIAAAQHQVAQANQDVATAQSQVAQAQQANAVAQGALAKATTALAKAQDALKPQYAQDFLAVLQQLKDEWKAFLDVTAEPVLGAAEAGLAIVTDVLKDFGPATKKAADAFGGLLEDFDRYIKNHPLFDRFIDVLNKFGPKFIRQFGLIIFGLLRIFLRLFIDFAPLSRKIGDGLVHMVRALDRWTYGFGKSKTFQSFVKFIQENGPILLSILGNLATIVVKTLIALAPVGAILLKALAPIIRAIARLDPDVILAIVAAVALLVDPFLGAALGAAALYKFITDLYNSSDDFKNFTDSVVGGLQDIGDSAPDFLSGLGDSFSTLVPQLQGLLQPMQDMLSSFVEFWAEVWNVFGEDIVAAVVGHLGGMIEVIKGAFKIISGIFQLFTDILKGDWQGVWDDLGLIVSGAWDIIKGTIRVAWADTKLIFQVISRVLSRIWDGIWEGLQTAASTSWDAIKTVVQIGMDAVESALVTALNAIIWVLNKLIDGINFLTHFVHIPAIPPIPTITVGGSTAGATSQDRSHTPGFGMADGGVLPGFTPGRDVHHFVSATGGRLALAGGESIMVPEWTKAVGGARAVAAMNAQARSMFATGGIFRPIGPDGQLSGNGIHDAYTGFPALDFGTHGQIGFPVAAVAAGRVSASRDVVDSAGAFTSYGRLMQVLHTGFESLYAHLSQRRLGVGAPVAAGEIIGLSGSTGNSTGPHLHFGVKGRSPYDFVNASTDYSGTATGAIQALKGAGIGLPGIPHIPNPASYLRNKLSEAMAAVAGSFNSPMGRLLKAVPESMLGAAIDKVKSLLGSLVSVTGPITGVDVAPGVSGYVGVVDKVLAELDPPQPRYLDSFVLQRMMKESRGDPNVVNKWDSNWLRGTPSVGLMQVIGPTFAAYAGRFRNVGPFSYGVSTNPEANIYAALNYSLYSGKYSGIYDAMTQPGGYDRGGVASGRGLLAKYSIAPERVLSPQDTQNFDRLVQVLDTAPGRSSRAFFTITNWKDGTGYMANIADGVGAQRAAYAQTLAGMNA